MKTGNCPRCQAPIVLVEHHRTARTASIDVQPTADGNVLVTGDLYEIVPKGERAMVQRRGLVLRKNHRATCSAERPHQGAKSGSASGQAPP
jgi:hypothetical protein